jgi:3-hydroxybutyryl-CoA dehydrogenase
MRVTFDQISQFRSTSPTMDILIIGTEDQINESRQKFGKTHHVITDASGQTGVDVIFDFSQPDKLAEHRQGDGLMKAILFLDTTTTRLSDILKRSPEIKNPVFGFCGLKTFVNREILEVAMKNETDRSLLESVCADLKTDFRIVKDQAGMITPRVITMIINEAYYTLEEGTATREDIDIAMKLGTNYPYGPFEWGERIGLGNVVAVLNAAEMETGDSRYAVCGLLKNAIEQNKTSGKGTSSEN